MSRTTTEAGSNGLHLKGVVAALLAVALWGDRAVAQTTFVAILEGAQEVPPVSTTATGTATLTLNAAEDSLTMTLSLSGVDLDGTQTADGNDNVTGLHIHTGGPGATGGVVFGLISPNSDLDGDLVIDAAAGSVTSTWDGAEGNGTLLSTELANLKAGQLYFNVHTVGNGGGEIRGQIVQHLQGVSLEALRFSSRDAPPFDCDEFHLGQIYLQRDIGGVGNLTHVLCICVGVVNGGTTYGWHSLEGVIDCSTLD